ncbi:MAG TPA: polyprenyl synthetase family protein [Candidatus Flavonifractor merdigallinarum]|uniref:Farnesyl diphosphate synthase n=1 Tax=Candidatus Flavonifractor merdigallinarum TaxID=2838589 RepID=A0A9D1Y8W5_9FIRM|nr:polyprenyl synthetase family protein [Candidatus Flavonifractor merdigallinarum]
MNYKEQLRQDCQQVEDWLRNCFRGRDPHADLYDAMQYSLLAGGKRLRPVLLLETCRMCGGEADKVLPFACAIEMLHTYSLIHDDLPAMDNDDLRRGRPTNHKVYGEATAILAGDALLTAAFETMLEQGGDLPPERVLAAAACLGRAAGARGMVGGQALDMAGEGHALSLSDVEELQRLKTGALIAAAVEMGCILAGGSADDRAAVVRYAQKLGLAFQIRDDMLDVAGDEQTLGKPIGSDAENEKTTFVTLKGLERCQELVEELTGEAQQALSPFGEAAGFLCWLAGELVGRSN